MGINNTDIEIVLL